MVDYMMISSKVNMLISGSQNICRSLLDYKPKISPNLRGNTWIILSLSIKNEKVAFQPNREEIRAILENLLFETINLIELNHSFFSSHDSLEQYIDPDLEAPEFQEFKEMCYMSLNFSSQVENFKNVISESVDTIQIYEEYIQPFISIYVENMNQEMLPY
jgi:hypothetical protein